ncbi:34 kDa spicule matrix protein [Drosophila erecta]|uniref:GG17038 n=1 Tax=Drosophila erecta TaxID=7220 RepID=B3P432_DROER|nr:34 kDa spicule matrix protein [Drosophila erecta]EDV49206.1 uncharacterized protein Dere_GG17038 [Drosophila erecta]
MRTFVCLVLATILLVAGSSAATYDPVAAQLLDVDAGVQAPSAARQVRQFGFGRPGFERPGFERPGFERPGFGGGFRPEFGRPGGFDGGFGGRPGGFGEPGFGGFGGPGFGGFRG